MIVVDLMLFLIIAAFCVRAYLHRQLWLALAGHLLGRLYRNKGFWRQLFSLGPVIVGWLLLCHWLANHGAPEGWGPAASCLPCCWHSMPCVTWRNIRKWSVGNETDFRPLGATGTDNGLCRSP